jgi:[CysO sulfur-carrier protein]-S-L-cysteine hydrolase
VLGLIRIRQAILAELSAQARLKAELECCGLLAGREGMITRIVPAPNALASASAYEIAAKDLFRLIRAIRAEGLDLMGIYHSHPDGKNEPSARDIEQAYYPDVAYFIVSPHAHALKSIRAFTICESRVAEIEIQVVE